jgi:hypothetical protein
MMNFDELWLYCETLESRIDAIRVILEAGDSKLLNEATQLDFIKKAVEPTLKILEKTRG